MRRSLLLICGGLLASCVAAPPPTTASPAATATPLSDGYYVKKYEDGSASVSRTESALDDHWSIDCSIDKMSDKRECKISSKSGGPFVYYGSSRSPQSVCVLGHDFPGRTAQIRIDQNTPVETSEEGCVNASAIIGQMRTGKTFLSRWVEWPYDYSKDTTLSLDGFGKALSVVNEIQNGNLQ